jgi:hypothetical protein
MKATLAFLAFAFSTSLPLLAAETQKHVDVIPVIQGQGVGAQCPDDRTVQGGTFRGCEVYAEAGVPYTGNIATLRICADYPIVSFAANVISTGIGGGVGGAQPYEWKAEDAGHLKLAAAVWNEPGDYKVRIYGTAQCKEGDESKDGNGEHTWTDIVILHVLPVLPPDHLIAAQTPVIKGQTYSSFAAVAFEQPIPKSGVLVRLQTSSPGDVDIKTAVGSTSRQSPSTYLWLKPEQPQVQPFDVLVSATAPSKVASIRAYCVGEYSTLDKCKALDASPLNISFKVESAPPSKK